MAEKAAEFRAAGRRGLPPGMSPGNTRAFTRIGLGSPDARRSSGSRCGACSRARHPSAFLLAAQLLSLLLYPLMDRHPEGAAVRGRGAGGRAAGGVGGEPQPVVQLRSRWLLAVPSLLLTIVGVARSTTRGCCRWPRSLEALLYFYAAGGLIAYMMRDMRVTRGRTVRGRRHVHAARVGLRLRLLRLPGLVSGQLHGLRARARTHVAGIAVLQLQQSVGDGPGRRVAGGCAGARAGDAGADRGRGLHRDGGVAPDRADDHPAAAAQ